MSLRDCPGGCGGSRRLGMFACRTCWKRLPDDMQKTIWATHAGRDVEHFYEVRQAAIAWYRDHPAPGEPMASDADAAEDGEPATATGDEYS